MVLRGTAQDGARRRKESRRVKVTLSTGDVFIVPQAGQPNFVFFGVTSTTQIDWVDFTAPSGTS